jgi:hypothetical protein
MRARRPTEINRPILPSQRLPGILGGGDLRLEAKTRGGGARKPWNQEPRRMWERRGAGGGGRPGHRRMGDGRRWWPNHQARWSWGGGRPGRQRRRAARSPAAEVRQVTGGRGPPSRRRVGMGVAGGRTAERVGRGDKVVRGG